MDNKLLLKNSIKRSYITCSIVLCLISCSFIVSFLIMLINGLISEGVFLFLTLFTFALVIIVLLIVSYKFTRLQTKIYNTIRYCQDDEITVDLHIIAFTPNGRFKIASPFKVNNLGMEGNNFYIRWDKLSANVLMKNPNNIQT